MSSRKFSFPPPSLFDCRQRYAKRANLDKVPQGAEKRHVQAARVVDLHHFLPEEVAKIAKILDCSPKCVQQAKPNIVELAKSVSVETCLGWLLAGLGTNAFTADEAFHRLKRAFRQHIGKDFCPLSDAAAILKEGLSRGLLTTEVDGEYRRTTRNFVRHEPETLEEYCDRAERAQRFLRYTKAEDVHSVDVELGATAIKYLLSYVVNRHEFNPKKPGQSHGLAQFWTVANTLVGKVQERSKGASHPLRAGMNLTVSNGCPRIDAHPIDKLLWAITHYPSGNSMIWSPGIYLDELGLAEFNAQWDSILTSFFDEVAKAATLDAPDSPRWSFNLCISRADLDAAHFTQFPL